MAEGQHLAVSVWLFSRVFHQNYQLAEINMYQNAFDGKTVLITGHTGFKGSWLSVYLHQLGAKVIGYSLPAPTHPSLFEQANIEAHIQHYNGDIRQTRRLKAIIEQHEPDYIFHMAAQPLVLEGYRNPVETFDVNVMGSISVMEAVRKAEQSCVLIMVVTDKCYENREWVYGYRETDPLGGFDPYSASKAAMDIAVASYRRSFFAPGSGVRIAAVRSGNVIGGGDWAENRIVPDAIRAFTHGTSLAMRNPKAQRPWQHVLEPLSGYLWLAARLSQADGDLLADAWNFGPQTTEFYTVGDLVTTMANTWGDTASYHDASDPQAVHEAGLLLLNIDKAAFQLGWKPIWDFQTTVERTVNWYQQTLATSDPHVVYDLCVADINAYEQQAIQRGGIAWTA